MIPDEDYRKLLYKRTQRRKSFIQRQRKLFEGAGEIMFLPGDGYCSICGFDIVSYYMGYGWRGDEEVITHCPRCHFLFCE